MGNDGFEIRAGIPFHCVSPAFSLIMPANIPEDTNDNDNTCTV